MRQGETIRVTYEGNTVDATVLLISPNQVSVFLGFEGMLGGHLGGMPLMRDDDGNYRSLVTGEIAVIGGG